MNEVANASINTFGPSPKADFETPSDQLITLTYGQLQGLIEAAIRPLQDEIAQLQEELASLEKVQDTLSENQLIQLRLIHGLKEKAKKDPGKTETSRAEKIEKYITSRPDHKATFESLKGMLQINNVLLNRAIKTLMNDSPGCYIITKAQGDKRKRTLIMLPK